MLYKKDETIKPKIESQKPKSEDYYILNIMKDYAVQYGKEVSFVLLNTLPIYGVVNMTLELLLSEMGSMFTENKRKLIRNDIRRNLKIVSNYLTKDKKGGYIIVDELKDNVKDLLKNTEACLKDITEKIDEVTMKRDDYRYHRMNGNNHRDVYEDYDLLIRTLNKLKYETTLLHDAIDEIDTKHTSHYVGIFNVDKKVFENINVEIVNDFNHMLSINSIFNIWRKTKQKAITTNKQVAKEIMVNRDLYKNVSITVNKIKELISRVDDVIYHIDHSLYNFK